jgi:hypothetical protein
LNPREEEEESLSRDMTKKGSEGEREKEGDGEEMRGTATIAAHSERSERGQGGVIEMVS